MGPPDKQAADMSRAGLMRLRAMTTRFARAVTDKLKWWAAARPRLDGNLWEEEQRKGVYIGRDALGNTYWEDAQSASSLRTRWVKYADTDYDATEVPPDWFGWLHASSDAPPSKVPHEHPAYEIQPRIGEANLALERPITAMHPAVYMPKGYAKHPHRQTWEFGKRWDPAQSAGRPKASA